MATIVNQKLSLWDKIKKYVFPVLAVVIVLALVGLLMAQINVVGPTVQRLAHVYMDKNYQVDPRIAPAWLVSIENAAPAMAWVIWGLMLVGVIYIARFMPKGQRRQLVESIEPMNVLMGLLVGGVLAGVTGTLWAVFNPVPILPPYVHLRVFAFLIGVWAITSGRGVGFITGYFGSIVWAWQAGAWGPFHTPLADGIAVGLFTGWCIAVLVRQGRSAKELLVYIQTHRAKYYLWCAIVSLVAGLVMAFFVAPSLKMNTPYSFFAGFWGIGVLSDTPAMVLWTGPVSELMLRVTTKISWWPDF